MKAIPIKTRYKTKGGLCIEECKVNQNTKIGSWCCGLCIYFHSGGEDEKGNYIRCKVNKLIR